MLEQGVCVYVRNVVRQHFIPITNTESEDGGMIIAIRHFPDKKRPCIVLEENNQALVLGYLTDGKREEWLRKALMMENAYQLAISVNSLYTLDEIMEEEP